MEQQLKHEAEQQRQHARYRIPLVLTTQGRKYKVRDWSVNGFSIYGLIENDTQKTFKATLDIQLDLFSMAFDVEAEPIWYDKTKNLTGCKFHDLNTYQLSVLRYIIDAFISGEVILAGDILQIARRDNLQLARSANNSGESAGASRLISKWTKGTFGFLALATVLTLLGLFTINSIYTKLFYVESPYAVVEGPIVVIRAPQPSYFDPLDVKVGQNVGEGDAIASIELINGGAVAIDSPCNCKVIKQHVLAREFVGTGEPLFTLLPDSKQLYVKAQIRASDLKKIEIGNSAKIRLPNNETFNAEIVSLQSGAPLEKRNAAVLNNTPTSPLSYIEAILKIDDTTLDPEYLNMPVSVVISTIL